MCERGLAHPSPRLGTAFARKGEGVERAEAGEGTGCFPRLEMIHGDALSTRCLPLFYLLYFTFFIVAKKIKES